MTDMDYLLGPHNVLQINSSWKDVHMLTNNDVVKLQLLQSSTIYHPEVNQLQGLHFVVPLAQMDILLCS